MEAATDSDRHSRGLEVLNRLTAGDPTLSQEMSTIAGVAPELSRLVVDFVFGEIYARPGLEPQRRHLVTLSCLVSVGAIDELRVHVGLALNTGLSSTEIVEAILHTAVYAGFPRAVSAMRVAQQVFIDRGILEPNESNRAGSTHPRSAGHSSRVGM
ncbi:carboxymuconolactone decarboxylase family protein [Actinophytocola sp.]|uniref:carboxymuconolactone decarboxylase family protein n=1 Tax=Actinophytocola sp. TaxID=1872138 RepID=UPI003D6C6AD8